MFFFYGFLYSAHFFCLFLLKCSKLHLFLLGLMIYWTIKLMHWKKKKKTRKAVYLLKISSKDTTGCSRWKYMTVFVSLLRALNKCHKLPSCVWYWLWALFAWETFHSIQHCFYKKNIFHSFLFFNFQFFIALSLQHICHILKATAC